MCVYRKWSDNIVRSTCTQRLIVHVFNCQLKIQFRIKSRMKIVQLTLRSTVRWNNEQMFVDWMDRCVVIEWTARTQIHLKHFRSLKISCRRSTFEIDLFFPFTYYTVGRSVGRDIDVLRIYLISFHHFLCFGVKRKSKPECLDNFEKKKKKNDFYRVVFLLLAVGLLALEQIWTSHRATS